jgi:hypothetical protein
VVCVEVGGCPGWPPVHAFRCSDPEVGYCWRRPDRLQAHDSLLLGQGSAREAEAGPSGCPPQTGPRAADMGKTSSPNGAMRTHGHHITPERGCLSRVCRVSLSPDAQQPTTKLITNMAWLDRTLTGLYHSGYTASQRDLGHVPRSRPARSRPALPSALRSLAPAQDQHHLQRFCQKHLSSGRRPQPVSRQAEERQHTAAQVAEGQEEHAGKREEGPRAVSTVPANARNSEKLISSSQQVAALRAAVRGRPVTHHGPCHPRHPRTGSARRTACCMATCRRCSGCAGSCWSAPRHPPTLQPQPRPRCSRRSSSPQKPSPPAPPPRPPPAPRAPQPPPRAPPPPRPSRWRAQCAAACSSWRAAAAPSRWSTAGRSLTRDRPC